MTKQQTTVKKPCDCGCGGKGEAKDASKMRKTDKGNLTQSLKDEAPSTSKRASK